MARQLLLGCGNSRRKYVRITDSPEAFEDLITVDIDESCQPDIVHDLNETPWPFDDGMFDEIHAYDVLEHLGRQGDYKAFFAHFAEIHRLLKPDGMLFAKVPSWDAKWAWGDPGHTRIISLDSLIYLRQAAYEQVGRTAMTDYRSIWKGNLVVVSFEEDEKQGMLSFVLQKKSI